MEIHELRAYLDNELHPYVSPQRYDLYSTIIDGLDEAIAEIERLRHEVAVRGRALELAAGHFPLSFSGPSWDVRMADWLTLARAELER